jgi:hypothetical protein
MLNIYLLTYLITFDKFVFEFNVKQVILKHQIPNLI